jgi:hypothetical protein
MCRKAEFGGNPLFLALYTFSRLVFLVLARLDWANIAARHLFAAQNKALAGYERVV